MGKVEREGWDGEKMEGEGGRRTGEARARNEAQERSQKQIPTSTSVSCILQ